MAFQFETEYNLQALSAMGKGLRKTLRKKRSRRVHIFAAAVVVLSLLLLLAKCLLKEPFDGKDAVTFAAVIAVLVTGCLEDRLNARIAKRRLLPGTEHADTVFEDDGYTVKTGAAESKWQYDKILAIAETTRYFVFVLSKDHAQAFDKEGMRAGSLEAFRAFITEKTGKPIQSVK